LIAPPVAIRETKYSIFVKPFDKTYGFSSNRLTRSNHCCILPTLTSLENTLDINSLFELNRLAVENGQRFTRHRDLYNVLRQDSGKHATGIIGPRGVGKTIILKQLAAITPDSCYVTGETTEECDLFELVKKLSEQYRIKTVFIDEIHYMPAYALALKKIVDFLDVKIFFSGSIALSLHESAVDLSRRIRCVSLPPFSFREYVRFKTGHELPTLSLEDIIERAWLADHVRQEYLFDEYLNAGLMPFSLEEPQPLPMLRRILEKVITRDIPFVARLTVDELPLIAKCVEFMGKSFVDGVNYSSLSRNIGITKYKAEQYISLLQKAFIVNPVLPAGANVSREPKILMCLPYRLLYVDFNDALGAIREDFFTEAMSMSGIRYNYLKSKQGAKTPDFVVGSGERKIIVEIGGRGKGREQFKGFEGTKSLILTHPSDTSGLRRPLFLAGFIPCAEETGPHDTASPPG